MKIKDLIKELQQYDPEIPVCTGYEDALRRYIIIELAAGSLDPPQVGKYRALYDGPKLVHRYEDKEGEYLLIQ